MKQHSCRINTSTVYTKNENLIKDVCFLTVRMAKRLLLTLIHVDIIISKHILINLVEDNGKLQ